MTKETLAELLNGREYRYEIDKLEAKEAKNNGLVVVFGYSDDNIEFQGAINDEFSCYGTGTITFTKSGREVTEEHLDLKEELETGLGIKIDIPVNTVKAIFGSSTPNCTWCFETDIPHAKFNIYEDDDLFCEGIVFSVNDLK